MIITIARQCGCMGDQIGKALAEKYFIPFYDKDAVCRLAKEKGLYEKYPYFYGEMPLDMMLYADTMAGDDTSDNGKTPRKAMEMGEIEGAMSSLSIAVAGILTVVLSSVFAGFM